MGHAGDHQLPAHLLEIFLLGTHREGRGILEEATRGDGGNRQQDGAVLPSPLLILTLRRTRVGRDAPAVP